MQERHSEEVPDIYGHGHFPYLAHVIEAITENKPALVEGQEGKKNVEILTALYVSAANGGAIVRPGCPVKHSKLGSR